MTTKILEISSELSGSTLSYQPQACIDDGSRFESNDERKQYEIKRTLQYDNTVPQAADFVDGNVDIRSPQALRAENDLLKAKIVELENSVSERDKKVCYLLLFFIVGGVGVFNLYFHTNMSYRMTIRLLAFHISYIFYLPPLT
jgi:hypothetical protein